MDRPGAAPPSLASWFTSPPTPAKASKQAQRKKKGRQNVRPQDDEWVQSLEKVCDRALLSQVRQTGALLPCLPPPSLTLYMSCPREPDTLYPRLVHHPPHMAC